MAKYFSPFDTPQYAEHVQHAKERLRLAVTDQAAAAAAIGQGLLSLGAQQIENKVQLFKTHAFLSLESFTALMTNPQSLKPRLVHRIWEQLVRHDIIMHNGLWHGNAFATHQLMPNLLKYHLKSDTLENVLFPPHRIASRYADAIAAVDVTKKESLHRGTGFLVLHSDKTFLITCKHNVDPDEGIEIRKIQTSRDRALSVGDPILHPTLDLALFVIETDIEPLFRLSDAPVEVFQSVYTIGYPKIPGADSALLSHRGEVNGETMLYLEKSPAILISNIVSAGNSGGPVLDDTGRCVAMTFRSIEAEYEANDKVRFSVALPVDPIRQFIEQIASPTVVC